MVKVGKKQGFISENKAKEMASAEKAAEETKAKKTDGASAFTEDRPKCKWCRCYVPAAQKELHESGKRHKLNFEKWGPKAKEEKGKPEEVAPAKVQERLTGTKRERPDGEAAAEGETVEAGGVPMEVEEKPEAKRRRLECKNTAGSNDTPIVVDGQCTICKCEVHGTGKELRLHLGGKKHKTNVAKAKGAAKLSGGSGEKVEAAAEDDQPSMFSGDFPMSEEVAASAPKPLYPQKKGSYGMKSPIKAGQPGFFEVSKDGALPEGESTIRVVRHKGKGVDGECLRALATYCGSTLQHLNLCHASSVTGADVVAVADSCRWIEVMDVRGVKNFDAACTRQLIGLLPRLKYLDARETNFCRQMKGDAPVEVTTPPHLLLDV